ncbi:hypothetical protein KXD40_008650 [Peronospora effusa]|nr:hypothetical protein KXD40_008650 [Peronospora effusa]
MELINVQLWKSKERLHYYRKRNTQALLGLYCYMDYVSVSKDAYGQRPGYHVRVVMRKLPSD